MLKLKKKCTRCNAVKPLEDFYKRAAGKYGRQSGCKACAKEDHKQAAAAYYKANSEKVKACTSKWRVDNPEKKRATSAKWARKNYEKVSASKAEWQVDNHEKCLASQAKYRKNNKGKVNARTAKRRAINLQRTPVWSDLNAIKDVYMEAQYFSMVVDHIIPLQGELVSGLHVWDNLQLLSNSDNGSKSNKFDIEEFNAASA